MNKVYVKNGLSGSCTAVDSIGARTVAVGQHVIVLADTNTKTWPQAYRPDSAFYQTFANEYDQVTWPHLLDYIGDPLAYDASLSKAGKVTVTITPVLNNFGEGTGGASVVAFVNGCDFFPYAKTGAKADFSNQTEMFYSWTPAATGEDVATWEKGLRGTAAHETKHIVSYADRIINNSADFEEMWLEEGFGAGVVGDLGAEFQPGHVEGKRDVCADCRMRDQPWRQRAVRSRQRPSADARRRPSPVLLHLSADGERVAFGRLGRRYACQLRSRVDDFALGDRSVRDD